MRLKKYLWNRNNFIGLIPAATRLKINPEPLTCIKPNAVIRSLLIFCLISAASFGQNNLRFTHYTTRDGLSDNIVTTLFQDSRGLLWIGTDNGLNYFDGISFQQIYPTDFDKVHLQSDLVTQLNEDADGNILLRTHDGIEEYNW